jgi:hypothetical protein
MLVTDAAGEIGGVVALGCADAEADCCWHRTARDGRAAGNQAGEPARSGAFGAKVRGAIMARS